MQSFTFQKLERFEEAWCDERVTEVEQEATEEQTCCADVDRVWP